MQKQETEKEAAEGEEPAVKKDESKSAQHLSFVEFLDFLTFLSTIPTFVILFIPNVVLLWWAFVLEIMGYEKGWTP